MIVNVEFWDENPIENVITSLHYKIDKTLFFGYRKTVDENRNCTEQFLKNICSVQKTEFCVVDDTDLDKIIDTIYDKISQELEDGNTVFFDLTGGESLPLVAFGILSREFRAPMHSYNIYSGEIHEYGYEGMALLSELAEFDPITLDLDAFISLYGGIVNHRLHKDFKNTWSQEDIDDITHMWKLSRKYSTKWLHYSALLRRFAPDDNLHVQVGAKEFSKAWMCSRAIGNQAMFNVFLDDCESHGFLKSVSHRNGAYKFTYKNDTIKNYFWDGGSILEMYAFLKESRECTFDDCRIGVHIDWDGVIHNSSSEDVLNEIDIMGIRNNLPVFISCKIGNVDQMALYELETIANRFGGKYAKKILVIAKHVSSAHLLRAEEMGIEIKRLSEYD